MSAAGRGGDGGEERSDPTASKLVLDWVTMFARFRTSHRRFKVYVVENARRDGKVVQETVAYLGSVDTRALMANGDDDRERLSIRERIAFWEGANPKLKNLINRLGGEAEVKRLRMAVHARVPWPMDPERERLRMLEEAHQWHHQYDGSVMVIGWNERSIASSKEQIAKAEEQNRELRHEALKQITQANLWRAKAEALRKQ